MVCKYSHPNALIFMSNIDIVESLYEREEEICKFMFKISGFFDEVSPKLEEQLAAMQTLGMRYLCPRNVNGKNIPAPRNAIDK